MTRIQARKSLGQHFLFDPDILNRTALAAGPVEGLTVLEVGPGPGGLTRALLDNGAARIVAVEADERFSEALRAWPEYASGQLQVIEGDALSVGYDALFSEYPDRSDRVRIVANLPYNVGTPLLVKWLKAGPWRGAMALMFQKEVGERICASPGTSHYGRLSVLCQAVMHCQIAFQLPPGAFKPPPKVASAVVVLNPLQEGTAFADLDALETITASAFGQRRKMLRASLKALTPPHQTSESWLETCGIDPTARAETLDQAAFRRLATSWRKAQSSLRS